MDYCTYAGYGNLGVLNNHHTLNLLVVFLVKQLPEIFSRFMHFICVSTFSPPRLKTNDTQCLLPHCFKGGTKLLHVQVRQEGGQAPARRAAARRGARYAGRLFHI